MPENPPRHRSTSDRLSGAVQRPSRCRSHTFTVPSTYESLLVIINRWIASCVMSRTEDSRGVPMHREESLVSEFSNLQTLWEETLSTQVGNTISIHVSYLSGPERVESLIFSIDPRRSRERIPRVVEGSPDIHHFRDIHPSPGIQEPDFESTAPDLQDAFSTARRIYSLARGADPTSAFRSGLTRTIRDNFRTLQEGDQTEQFQGRVIGFADTLARMASELNPRVLESPTIPLRPTPVYPSHIPEAQVGRLELDDPRHPRSPFFRQGYIEGFHIASDFLRINFEQTRAIDEETGRAQGYASAFFLQYLRAIYGTTRLRIFIGLRRDYLPDINRLPREYGR